MDAIDIASTIGRFFRSGVGCLLAVVIGYSSAAASEFDDANRLYEQGKFAEAKQKYEGLAERGEFTSNLFHNLGNTDFRLGSPGRAMLGYERALALEPAHPEAQRNLTLLRERAGSQISPRLWYDVLFPRWSGDVFTLLCTVAAWIALFCFAFGFASRVPRPALGWLGILAIAVALYAGVGVWRDREQQGTAIVTAKEAVARLAPAEQSDVASTLPAGSRVSILTQRGDWIYCRLPGEGLGWIRSEVLERVRIRT